MPVMPVRTDKVSDEIFASFVAALNESKYEGKSWTKTDAATLAFDRGLQLLMEELTPGALEALQRQLEEQEQEQEQRRGDEHDHHAQPGRQALHPVPIVRPLVRHAAILTHEKAAPAEWQGRLAIK